ncbi:C2 domain-containing protein 3 isoform X2 [Paroedura picta]|uniref:C2 domain-containing protein 3 isoform X2 n=1 Tax=Paroedura picta TaxID=143630 RepID=UPI0040560624
MKLKKPKSGSARAGPGARRKGLSDVSPSTSLPPLVEGQLRCFLKLTVSKILWMVTKPPASTVVRVRWWGETSDGTVFIPRGTSQVEQKTFRTTTRYPVRCGPKQFTSYLTDMGALVLELMTRTDHLPIGRVQICGLSQLSPSHPISGFFSIVSPTSEKMGELQVSLVLEPLSETYDSNSSVPNTDVSFSAGLPTQGAKEASDSGRLLAPSQLHRPPGGSLVGSESISSSRSPTPRGKDHLYFAENHERIREAFVPGLEDRLRGTDPKHRVLLPTGSVHEAQVRQGGGSPGSKDLLSALLDQGNKLRNAMAASAMKSTPIELYETLPSTKRDDRQVLGMNWKNLNSVLLSSGGDPLHPLANDTGFDLHAENRAIQLLLGSSDIPPGELLDGSPMESISLGSEVYGSELNDPHYDQSLLENLFYTAQKSDSSLSDFLSDEGEPSSCGKRGKRQRPRHASESSSVGQKGKALETKASSPARPLPLPEPPVEPAGEELPAIHLSLDRLAMLGRIHLARVVIETLRVPLEGSSQNTPSTKSSMGKPPKPTSAQRRTFFVEYHFPVKATKNGIGQVAVTTEIIRVASSKISNGVLKYQQRYVFPVHFSGTMITHWWNSDLAFNVYLKKGAQRKPLLIGSAAFPLRDVIQSEPLTVSRELPVQEEGGSAQLGPLKVSLELAADNKDFSSASTKPANVAAQAPVYFVTSPGGVKLQDAPGDVTPVKSPPLSQHSSCQLRMKIHEARPAASEKLHAGAGQQPAATAVSRCLLPQTGPSEEEGLLLHVLLMVPEGADFVPGDAGLHRSCNVYLNCKLFSTEEATRSAVVWGTRQPAFCFSQVTPVSLTSKHLERLKNNVMVIEAWNKRPSPGGDQLLGLVKLPLHQFYVSFKDPKISTLLLQAQYPVVAVDGALPVIDVFSGNKNGTLKVLLAMGSADQIVALQRLKNEEGAMPPSMQRSAHALDPPETPLPKLSARGGEGLMEHVFEVHIESAKGLTPLQSTVWGEADCYVQYHFPVQESETGVLRGTEVYESGLRLKPFRSATALCIPDPVFNDERHHSLLVPADVPVQRLLLSAFSTQGLAGGGGIQFEIWCRYYYPNVRDQMIARGTLSLSRLCAMVTMQRRDALGIQTFSLPLIPRTEISGEPQSSGLLDVSIKYRCSLKAAEGVLATQVVVISIQIHRAAGLQAAARALAEKNPSLRYSSDVGVNAYVIVNLPFLPEGERRSTRSVARTFCPEFEHHTEFPCSLVVQRSSGEACCLGELLQYSEAVFFVFHQNLNSAPGTSQSLASRDYLLGTVKVPTRELLMRRSGIRGWYPVTLPEELVPSHCAGVTQTIVGGLELSVSFARPGDRERVLDAAALLGWNQEETLEDSLQDGSDSPLPPDPARVTVSIPRLWLPAHCLFLAGQTQVSRSTYCYLRYKLYDQEATWTSLRRPRLAEDKEHAVLTFKSSQVDLLRSPALSWYFREERLEFQVWRAYGNERHADRPLDTDRLIGSAYVDLTALSRDSGSTRTVSGVYPLFRRNASNLAGAAVRIHIALASATPRSLEPPEHGDSSGSSECEGGGKGPVTSRQDLESQSHKPEGSDAGTPVEKSPEEPPVAMDPLKTFAVSVLVERAMHLSLKGSPLTERGVTAPSSCVSFVTADPDSPVTTEIVDQTDSPVWDFQRQSRLSSELLLDPQQTLVFKVWHKADVERVIGFASVDLSPLLSGFQLVCGWYNITDFSGQCQGQIKVAVSPLESIVHLKEERQARSRSKAPGSAIPATIPFAFQARDLCTALPPFSARGAEELFHPRSKGTEASSRERAGSSDFSLPRHEEHVQNIRRFHESLQQAEGNAHRAIRLESLSQSSRTSLLRALSKNLSELDEIQRYFSQKLTRPFPERGTPDRTMDGLSGRHPGLASGAVDPEGQHLLEKSSHLVSQVSNLIDGLNNHITRSGTASSCAPEASSSRLDSLPGQREGTAQVSEGPQDLLRNGVSSSHADNGPFFSLEEASCARGMLYEFLGQASSQRGPPLATHSSPTAEEAAESHSDDDYEEDVLEPRTLNEITTVTDKTSPWSSLVSEGEQDHDQEAGNARGAGWPDGCTEALLIGGRPRSSSLSSMTQEDSQSTGPSGEEGAGRCRTQKLKGGPEDPPHPIPGLSRDCFNDGPSGKNETVQEGALEIQAEEAGVELAAFSGDLNFALEYAPEEEEEEEEEGREGSLPNPQQEEGADSDKEELRHSPELPETAQHPDSCSEEGDHDPPEDSREPLCPRVVLSSPVTVPNFFLPPQHLEASMRLLSVSASPLTSIRKSGNSRTAGGAPRPRQNRQKPTLAPAQLPEEETKRIARIFSTQFSKS